MDQAEGEAFVRAFLDGERHCLDVAFQQTLTRQTEGHPLFTVELLRGMQERGDLVQDGEGCWVAGAALDWATLPVRVEAVIAERIERLPEALQALLRVAGVEGETFTAEAVAQVQLYRMRGLLRLQQNEDSALEAEADFAEVEDDFRRAITAARRMEARMCELRATVCLARLWQQRGQREQAHQALAEIYGWSTEGFETRDLQEAKALLEELAVT